MLNIGILEAQSIGQKYSVINGFTHLGKEGHQIVMNESFKDKKSFEKSFLKCSSKLGESRGRKLLIISAHGVPASGTKIQASSTCKLDIKLSAKVYGNLPKSTFVYLSICFGGYAAIVENIRIKNIGKDITFIGPLFYIDVNDDLNLLCALVKVLENSKNAFLFRDISLFWAAWNSHFREEYNGFDSVRVVYPDGLMVPPPSRFGMLSMPRKVVNRLFNMRVKYPDHDFRGVLGKISRLLRSSSSKGESLCLNYLDKFEASFK